MRNGLSRARYWNRPLLPDQDTAWGHRLLTSRRAWAQPLYSPASWRRQLQNHLAARQELLAATHAWIRELEQLLTYPFEAYPPQNRREEEWQLIVERIEELEECLESVLDQLDQCDENSQENKLLESGVSHPPTIYLRRARTR